MKYLLLLLPAIFLTACFPLDKQESGQLILFSFSNISIDSLNGPKVLQLESRAYNFLDYDTLKSVDGIPAFLNDSQMVSRSLQFLPYHKLLLINDAETLQSNVFELWADSAHFEVTVNEGALKVRNTARLHSRYPYPEAFFWAGLSALLLELIILIVLFSGMHVNVWYAFHSVWLNILFIPLVLWFIASYYQVDFPVAYVLLLAVICLKALFFYFATYTIRHYRRFFVIMLFSTSLGYVVAWFSYYLMTLL